MTSAPATGGSRESDPDEVIATARLAGRPLLLMLDIDGTLAPIVSHPSHARVPDETRRALAALSAQADVVVVFVSGRSASDARQLAGVEHTWTIGNHGAEVIAPDGAISVDEGIAQYATAIADAARALSPEVSPLNGVLLENKRWTLSIHYRTADERSVPTLRDAVRRVAAEHDLRVIEGKKVLEIRPPVHVNKGSAIASLARELGGFDGGASVLFAGDDTTDEDAFRLLRNELPRAVTIHVGHNVDTAAEFRFADLGQVRVLLEHLVRDMTTSR